MAKEQVAPRTERDAAWSEVLKVVAGHEGLTWEEKAAAIVLVVAEQDGLDSGETVADLRRVLDRGLAGLKSKNQIEQIPGGDYRLKRGTPARQPMVVDSETPAEAQAPTEEAGDKPVIA